MNKIVNELGKQTANRLIKKMFISNSGVKDMSNKTIVTTDIYGLFFVNEDGSKTIINVFNEVGMYSYVLQEKLKAMFYFGLNESEQFGNLWEGKHINVQHVDNGGFTYTLVVESLELISNYKEEVQRVD